MDDEIPCGFSGCQRAATWELEYWSPIPSVAYTCSEHLAELIPREGETRVRPLVEQTAVAEPPRRSS